VVIISAADAAGKLGGTVNGNPGETLSGISDLKGAKEGDVSFILDAKHAGEALKSAAKVIISDSLDSLPGKTVIKVKNARLAYIGAIKLFFPDRQREGFISDRASVSKKASLGKNVVIGDFAVVKDGVVLGDGVLIGDGAVVAENCRVGSGSSVFARVTLYPGTVIGERCIIHSGAVIGADGFGFVENEGSIVKVPQTGNVLIKNDVEIGANTTIDRAAFGSTIIGNSCKLDNLVQIGHNVELGDGVIIAAQTGISGSVKIGNGCLIGGQVGFADHITVGRSVKIGSQSGVSKDTPDGAVISGTPARPLMEQRRTEAYAGKLGELFKRVKAIEADAGKPEDKK